MLLTYLKHTLTLQGEPCTSFIICKDLYGWIRISLNTVQPKQNTAKNEMLRLISNYFSKSKYWLCSMIDFVVTQYYKLYKRSTLIR